MYCMYVTEGGDSSCTWLQVLCRQRSLLCLLSMLSDGSRRRGTCRRSHRLRQTTVSRVQLHTYRTISGVMRWRGWRAGTYKISSSWVWRFMSYRANELFCPISQWWKIGKSGPVTLTFDLWPWHSLGFVRLSRNMFVQNFSELSSAVRELSCVQRKKAQTKQYSPSLPRGR